MVVVGHLRFAGIGKRPDEVELQQPNNVDNNNNTDVADKTDVSFILFRSVFFLRNFTFFKNADKVSFRFVAIFASFSAFLLP